MPTGRAATLRHQLGSSWQAPPVARRAALRGLRLFKARTIRRSPRPKIPGMSPRSGPRPLRTRLVPGSVHDREVGSRSDANDSVRQVPDLYTVPSGAAARIKAGSTAPSDDSSATVLIIPRGVAPVRAIGSVMPGRSKRAGAHSGMTRDVSPGRLRHHGHPNPRNRGFGCFISGSVARVLVCVDGELSEELAGDGVGDSDVEVPDEEHDVGSLMGSADADVAGWAVGCAE